MAKKLWFPGFKRHSGFSKEFDVDKNLRVMYKNTRLKSPENAWRRVGRQAQSLANISQDKATKMKSQMVATAAFKKLEKLKV